METTQLSCETLLKQENLLGRDMEFIMNDIVVFRGPIGAINKDHGMVVLSFKWCARMDTRSGQWQNWTKIKALCHPLELAPRKMFDGRIIFLSDIVGLVTVFPENAQKLKIEDVAGLTCKQVPKGGIVKKKVLVMSVKYSVTEDSSEEIMKILTGSNLCEPELVKCLGSKKLDALHEQIEVMGYDVVFIVWEWAFDIEQLQTFTRLVHAEFPKLRLVVASNRPGCCELLKKAGCCGEIETGSHPEVFPKLVLAQIKTK
jgi:hypothetical protein